MTTTTVSSDAIPASRAPRLIELRMGVAPATEGDIVGIALDFEEAALLRQWAQEGAS